MAISWVDFSIANYIKMFSLSLEKNDFLFLAGETCHDKLLRALAGFLPEECNSADSIRIDGHRLKNRNVNNSVLLPKNATRSFPPHRTIGAFALDLVPGYTKKIIENYAVSYGIDKQILSSKPGKISPLDLQRVSLWLCSLKPSTAIFIEEPDGGFFDECRPFDFLQRLVMPKSGITSCIVYLASQRDCILKKAKALQFCRARIAVFCADRLVEEGEAAKVLENPAHAYTREWLERGTSKPLKTGALWRYCKQDCPEQYNCTAKQNVSSVMWDCEPPSLHKVVCKGFGGT